MALAIRPAGTADRGHFLRLFPELGVDDPLPSPEKFERELMPTMLLAEAEGVVAGYAYYQRLGATTYVRHIVTAPTHRRRGVGAALLAHIRSLYREGTWCLNVKADNEPALALYRRSGLEERFRTWPIRLPWACLDSVDAGAVHEVAPKEDEGLTTRHLLVPGLLADARAKGRIVVASDGAVAGDGAVAVFDPEFPGAYPFRAETGHAALSLLAALRAFAKHDYVQVVVEGQPVVRDALERAGGAIRFEIVHLAAQLG